MQKPFMPINARRGLLTLALLLTCSLPAFGSPAGTAPAGTVPTAPWAVAQVPPSLEASPLEAMPAVSLPFEQAVLSGLPPRQPWIAMGLSLAVTGSGQFYNRDSNRGWWLFGTLATYPVAMAIDAWTGSGYARVGAFSLMMAAKGYSAWEAFHTASASASATP